MNIITLQTWDGCNDSSEKLVLFMISIFSVIENQETNVKSWQEAGYAIENQIPNIYIYIYGWIGPCFETFRNFVVFIFTFDRIAF